MGIATGNDDELVDFNEEIIIDKFNQASSIYYRPFDFRFIIFDNKILQRARFKLMNNYHNHSNIGLNIVHQSKLKGIESIVSKNLANRDLITYHTYNFPLYLYPEASKDGIFESQERVPILNMGIVEKIGEKINHIFLSDDNIVCDLPTGFDGHFSSIDILDYIYAVLHSPSYREKYKEFLKNRFPESTLSKGQGNILAFGRIRSANP